MNMSRQTAWRFLRFALCLSLGGLCPISSFLPLAAAAESIAPKPEQAPSMIEKKRIICERAKALADFGAVREEPASWMKEYADQAVEGLLPFDAGIWVKVGLKDIDWSGGQYPHVEWGQTLNRWPQIDSLASMYRKTRIERYAQTARAYLEDYIRHDPGFAARRKERSDTTLSVAIRIKRWETCLPAFLDSPSFDDEFVQSILDSVATQARDLSQHLTGTNFRLAELDALVFTGLRLPFLPNAKELLAVGVAGMRESGRSVPARRRPRRADARLSRRLCGDHDEVRASGKAVSRGGRTCQFGVAQAGD